jgi:hypothetical protein
LIKIEIEYTSHKIPKSTTNSHKKPTEKILKIPGSCKGEEISYVVELMWIKHVSNKLGLIDIL